MRRTRRGIYPIAVKRIPPIDRARIRSPRRLQRALRARARLRCGQRVVEGLNWLWGKAPEASGGPVGELQGAPAVNSTAGSQASLRGAENAAFDHYRRLATVVAENQAGGDVELDLYESSGRYEMIVPERLALPKGGEAGSVRLMDCLPGAWQDVYADINNLIKKDVVGGGRWARVSHGCATDGDYGRLCLRLKEARMIEYSEEEPPVLNGCFAVPKHDPGVVLASERRQRLIGNMVPGNRFFVAPPPCKLPHLGVISELSVTEPCFSSKTDLDTFYYRFEVPSSWRPYFSLPPVFSDAVGEGGTRRRLYPRFRVLVMGWSHSVALAQVAHQFCLYREGRLSPGLSLSYPMHQLGLQVVREEGAERLDVVGDGDSTWRLLPEDPPRPAQIVMVDDLGNTHGGSTAQVNALLEKAVQQCYEPAGLVVNQKKVAYAVEGQALEILGVEFSQDGSMRPSAARLHGLVRDTQAVLDAGWTTYHGLASLLGRWVWLHLLRRCLLSIWFHAYRMLHDLLIKSPRRRYMLWDSVRAELWAAICLAPLVLGRRDQPLSTTVVATDASDRGSGVVYAELDVRHVRDLSNCREMRGWQTLCVGTTTAAVERTGPGEQAALAAATWRTAVAHRWRDPSAHINEKEMRAAVQGVEWSLRSLGRWNQRHVRLVDNTAVLGALVKGRSSSYRLNTWCRRAAALALASDTKHHWVYVRSAQNPADAPSRGRWVRDLAADGDVERNPGPGGRVALLEATVQRSTLLSYQRSVAVYLAWNGSAAVSRKRAEANFCDWLESVYDSGGSRSLVVRALCGLQLYYPAVVKHWQEARRLLLGWRRQEPVHSPCPVPWRLLYLVANILLAQGEMVSAYCCIIVFQQYLRIGEAFKLTVGDVGLPGDRRLGPHKQGALLLRDPKTAKGQAQAVVVLDPLSLHLLTRLCAGRRVHEPLFGALNYSKFARRWQRAWSVLGLQGMFPPYSLRHGGATHAYLGGTPLVEIQKRGRWRQFSSVDHYVGLHRALQVTVPPAVWGLTALAPPRQWRRHFL